jgi:hypothetical protein
MNHKMEKKEFEVVEEKVVYKRYLIVSDRKVKFPNGKVIDWDVVGHAGGKYVCVFPYDAKNVSKIYIAHFQKTTTIVKEYCQGSNDWTFGFPCGQ